MREDPESESVSICESWAASSFPVVRSPVTEMFLTLEIPFKLRVLDELSRANVPVFSNLPEPESVSECVPMLSVLPVYVIFLPAATEMLESACEARADLTVMSLSACSLPPLKATVPPSRDGFAAETANVPAREMLLAVFRIPAAPEIVICLLPGTVKPSSRVNVLPLAKLTSANSCCVRFFITPLSVILSTGIFAVSPAFIFTWLTVVVAFALLPENSSSLSLSLSVSGLVPSFLRTNDPPPLTDSLFALRLMASPS